MMKKCMSLLLALLMLLPAFAVAEDVILQPTVDELMAFCDTLLSEALKMPKVTPVEGEEGGFVFDYGSFELISPEKVLDADSVITSVTLLGGEEYRVDMRNVAPGSDIYDVLDAYPLDNATLRGTYEEAALYISGMLPETVNAGYVVRNGSHVLVAEYDIYAVDGDTVEKCCVLYTLENNVVIAVEIILNAQTLTLAEAQSELDRLSALQEEGEYSVYSADQPEALAREDLSFNGIDFISASPDAFTEKLGKALSDTWEADGGNHLRIMQWEGAQAIFQYDAGKQNASLRLLQVFSEALEGPRGLHMGDNEEIVLSRFPQDINNNVLYGDGKTAPYGLYETIDGTVHMTFAVQVEEETVLLSLVLIDGLLADMTCNYL